MPEYRTLRRLQNQSRWYPAPEGVAHVRLSAPLTDVGYADMTWLLPKPRGRRSMYCVGLGASFGWVSYILLVTLSAAVSSVRGFIEPHVCRVH
jgi:hypothetical protein